MVLTKKSTFKYKLLAILILLFLAGDIAMHKGMVRVMIPKTFLNDTPSSQKVFPEIFLANKNKEWMKAVNTPDRMNTVTAGTSGIEMDIYFDSPTKTFSVHHDINATVYFQFEDLLNLYLKRKLTASIWMDFKNLSSQNQQDALTTLISLRKKYHLENKILVESSYPELLNPFSDQNFFTSYYTPYFNPYLLDQDSLKAIARQMQNHLDKSRVQALSGYYFQFRFLHERFPNYPILIWGSDDRFSLVNFIYTNFINDKKEVFIKLNP